MKSWKYSVAALAAVLVFILSGCGRRAEEPVQTQPTPEPTVRYESGAGKAVLSELMPKNKATIRDDQGQFTDWVEIANVSGTPLDLTGWVLHTGSEDRVLDGIVLQSGEYYLVFANVAQSGEVVLTDRNGDTADRCEIKSVSADRSLVRSADGSFKECMYPTPGYENTGENFDMLQTLRTPGEELTISEVCVDNFTVLANQDLDYMDYVEVENTSSSVQDFGGWALTDDLTDPAAYVIPEGTRLLPGERLTIWCEKDQPTGESAKSLLIAPFSLDGDNDRIYLIAPDGTVADYTPLKDIPYGMTYGRITGQNGFFYLETPSPGKGNECRAERRVCETPVTLSEDGVFENTKSVTVELSATGDIYYTTDGSVPTPQSEKYTGPFTVEKTCIIRAVAAESGCMESRTLTLNYFINEGNTLPVVSVVADNKKEFELIYNNAQSHKGTEMPGVISYYGENGSFTMGSGIKMHGFSTLNMPKKNMSFRFRSCYGNDTLDFDLFEDGGVTNFTNLVLRSGGDQKDTIVKNEVCLDLAASYSDSLVITRHRYVVVYINGEYSGIYSLMEKTNEQWFADSTNVTKSSVTMEEEPVYEKAKFRQEVLNVIFEEDVSDPEVYAKVCQVLDIDALIDWTLIEGISGNWDLESGNLRYAKSSESGDQWTLILYDLDQAFTASFNCFGYVIGTYTMGAVNQQLLKNETYKQQFLERASYVLQHELSVKEIWRQYEVLAAQIDADVKQEAERNDSSISYESWKKNLEKQEELLLENSNWYQVSAKTISHYCSLTAEEQRYWFGDI